MEGLPLKRTTLLQENTESPSISQKPSALRITGYGRVPPYDLHALKWAIIHGPVTACIEATPEFCQHCQEGIFRGKFIFLNHVVLITGFGRTLYGERFFEIQNSWGTEWGNKGKTLIIDEGYCNLAAYAHYPTMYGI
ncbi:senescence-specific cysteine protease SAG12 [Helianthus annuus]|uniref:senescence-specific cysteine protease SAG12 n=1 Tax=Helianthus annuus TaxID=4232 RepID=UPI000B8F1B7F|nr:senescence-specific cysteine protease SAG12 [Helianthus annuus]